MRHAGVVTGARVTHESGSVDDLAAVSPDSQRTGVASLLRREPIEEAFVLSTCNRVEAYVVAADPAVGRAALEEFFAGVDERAVVETDHDASLKHLLRVATGLESVVLGEDQIIGQVRTAYEDARGAGGIGQLLETAVTKAIHVGERARTETAINEGVVSLGSAATRMAARELPLEGATALVVGAGEMGRLAARSLVDAGISELIVANRTIPHAEHLVSEFAVDGNAIPLGALRTVAPRADVVVAATGSDEPVVVPSQLGEREQVVVDLGQPRDVCPTAGSLPEVTVYDLDDLETITAETREQRADAAREVEAMVDREFELLCEQYKRARADEAIAAMYESAERVKARELETALTRLDDGEFSEEQREIVRSLADALVGQLLAPPTKSLREAAAEDDWETINTALQLFDPEFGPAALPPSFDRAADETSVGATDDD
ncbi:glutamyl-tRNA reductase [Natrononativus amylolyticus]|uniref:glutamyl-tRNA reductase n=1 Tax=Natrononativus amylolyticus TaxID=2963434 RepID=UPI0020CEC173|nr:glutamyl-tRNA reductase [Natrononativus amylolyticus]